MADRSLSDRVPLAAGAVAGAAASLLGYLITYVWQSGSVEERLQGFNFLADLFGGDPIPVWKAVGWLFYNAHFVRTRFEGGLGGPRSENFIAAAEGGSLALLYLVPVVLLIAAGVALVVLQGASEPADGALAGASVALGYLPLAVVGAFLFSYDGSIAPDTVTAVLLAGVVYPLALGTVGGGVAVIAGLGED
ncbi:transporter [Haloparvum sedimenti]|uniref:transporter n=1 Tax=Haloparvum sedimenti TaxID=1678448 RepID=UPI000AA72B8E|nr:transporter [Haloparvum sedimenti]